MLTPFLLKLYGILFNKFHETALIGQVSIKSIIHRISLQMEENIEVMDNGHLTMMDNTLDEGTI